jgi:hypothetical protein
MESIFFYLTIVPCKKNIVLKVFQGDSLLYNFESILAIEPPSPMLSVQTIPYNKKGYLDTNTKNLNVRLVSSSDQFKFLFPHDARYKLISGVLSVYCNDSLILRQDFNEKTIDVKSLLKPIRRNAILKLQVREAKRMNFKGETETVNCFDKLGKPEFDIDLFYKYE